MIKNRFTLKQLEAFVCVVDAGSFRKAADLLGTTQPNISNRIATLEQSLDRVLMHRNAGSVGLTEKGAALLPAAREVLRAAETFLTSADRHDLVEDRMRLGVTELIACTWLHDFLREFRQLYPGVSVELDVDLSVAIEAALAEGRCDLGLVADPGGVTEAAPAYAYVWVAAPSLVAGKHRPACIADFLQAHTILHARHSSAVRDLRAFCKDNGTPTDRLVCSSSLISCLQMALDGMGVAMIPRVLAQRHLISGALLELHSDWVAAPLAFRPRFDASRAPPFVQRAASLAMQIARQQDKVSEYP